MLITYIQCRNYLSWDLKYVNPSKDLERNITNHISSSRVATAHPSSSSSSSPSSKVYRYTSIYYIDLSRRKFLQ